MNTYLNTMYLKLCKIDMRTVRLALSVFSLLAAGRVILSLPINGDIGG